MKRALGTIALALSLACLGAASALAFGVGSGTVKDVSNEASIRELYKDFTAAWNRHDIADVSGRWALDGDHIEPDGTVAKGRDEVTALLTRQHSSVFKDTVLDLKVETVWFIRGDVALVDGSYSISGIHDLDGNEIAPRSGHLTSVLLQEKNKWWIAASRLMIPTSLPYKKKDQ